MKINIIFIEYYRLVSFKWGTNRALKWIFGGRLKGARWVDCCRCNESWQRIFEDYGLTADRKTLKDYFSYQIYRYYQSEYPPSVSTLFNQKSLLLFLNVYNKKHFKWLIKKPFEYRNFENMNNSELKPMTKEFELFMDDEVKKNYIKRLGFEHIYINCCLFNRIYFRDESKYCHKCIDSSECRKRKVIF
jgi:hypothetical protein